MNASATRDVQETQTLICVVCDAENTSDVNACVNCGAPMELVRETLAQERKPCIITVIGDSNVGKTVYLGVLLDMLSKHTDDFDSVPKGPYSVNLQHTVISYLGARHFPPKTAMEVDEWQWAYYQVSPRQNKDEVYDLVMPDMAGEALSAEVSSPNTFAVIRSLLDKSAAVIMLVDAAMAAAGSPQPDFFALKLMAYLDGVRALKHHQKIKTPIAVVLSKGDYCPECFDDPNGFAKTNLNRVWNMCDNRYENVAFFATSVVGALGYGTDEEDNVIPYPLHIAPRGIVEPFEWVLAKLKTL